MWLSDSIHDDTNDDNSRSKLSTLMTQGVSNSLYVVQCVISRLRPKLRS